MMSLWQCPLLVACVSKKEQDRGRWMAWACLGSAVERPWLALGGSILSSFGLRKQSSGLLGTAFLAVKLYRWYRQEP